MTGGRKRTAADRDLGDPSDFLQQYFDRRGIAAEVGTSPVEQECIRRAEEAREQFKRARAEKRSDDVRPALSEDADVLTPAQKYNRRLMNNRKSAAAARVFQEVLKREQAYTLQTVAEERDRFASERSRLGGELKRLQDRVAKLQKENERLAMESKVHQQLPIPDKKLHVPLVSPAGPLQPPPAPHNKFINRGMMSSWSNPMSLSPLQDGSEPKYFPTGLTCSQSQNEEEDKGLNRHSLPLNNPLPIHMIGSQPSQSDLPVFRCSVGSEDIPMGDPEFFLGSQGVTSQGRSVAAT